MANKRMISKNIVDSDAFLSMPTSTQNLYFHMNVRADDEGFIDKPMSIMRLVNASEDDMKVLLSKRYLLRFDSGVIVIKHWKLHNTIRKDRLIPTVYQEERKMIFEKENGAYTDDKSLSIKEIESCQPSDGQLVDKCTHRLDQISIDKDSIDSGFDDFWNAYPKKMSKKKASDSYAKLVKAKSLPNNLIDIVKQWANTEQWKKDNGQFIPLAATWLNQERWNDELPKEQKKSTGYAPNITDNGLRFEA